ncbi:amphi-Trp domain-containing protein [Halomarina oriensis]|uniref:Amphi-Trp domain-containing protein n=1 Tax=Halomarina oriensis TaxID=671145 RepID=A0A6B0GKH5_9EURY|nr:amphi-Trp domain-containing protein [Halomarina oriensis]MWG34307.1 amphi-Trp domain-containing protein [Halomarina oriensis]
MAETTKHTTEMTREELANYLRGVAEEFEHDDRTTVNVGNKRVELNPASTVDCTVSVEEKSRLLGSDSETLTIVVDWKLGGD